MQPTPTPPIADPNEKPRRHFEGAEVREFRVRFWLYCLSTLVLSVLFAGVILGLFYILGAEQFRVDMVADAPVLLLIAVVLTLVLCAYVWRFLPLKVGRWGLRAVTFWTTPQEVAWSQVSRVRYGWFGFPYALVTCASAPKLWVWLALDDTRGFAASVAAFTAPDHPLHAFLIERGLLES